MPARTNDFQTLVHLIYGQLAPDGYTVVESKTLLDRRDGKGREVDVVIEGAVGPHPVVISIEATKGGRRADLEWVERLCAKHEHLPTNKLVLISRGGFTPRGAKEAQARGADALTFQQASERDWRIPMNLKSIESEHRPLYPTDFTIMTSPSGPRPLLGGRLRDLMLHFEGGIRKAPLVYVVQTALADAGVRAKLDADTSGPDNWRCKIDLTFRDGTLVVGPDDTTALIEGLSFTARYAQSNTHIELQYASFGDHRFAHGSANTGVGDLVALIMETPSGASAVLQLAIVPGSDTGGVGLQILKRQPAGPT